MRSRVTCMLVCRPAHCLCFALFQFPFSQAAPSSSVKNTPAPVPTAPEVGSAEFDLSLAFLPRTPTLSQQPCKSYALNLPRRGMQACFSCCMALLYRVATQSLHFSKFFTPENCTESCNYCLGPLHLVEMQRYVLCGMDSISQLWRKQDLRNEVASWFLTLFYLVI